MNRRNFLASLIALPAAVKAVCLNPGPRKLLTPWLQTRRISRCVSPEYEKALGCTLTRATFTPISPADFAAMSLDEFKLSSSGHGPASLFREPGSASSAPSQSNQA